MAVKKRLCKKKFSLFKFIVVQIGVVFEMQTKANSPAE